MLGLKSFVNRHRIGTTLLVLVLVSVVLVILSNENLDRKPKEISRSFFHVFQVVVSKSAAWFRDRWNSIGELKRVRDELAEARERLAEYEWLSHDIVELREENNRLLEQLGFLESVTAVHVPAEVIARDPGNFFSTIIVNRGAKHGIKRNMPVVAFQLGAEGLVGLVVAVGRSSSFVRPLVDPQCHVAARLQRTRYEGLVSGAGPLSSDLLMQYVNADAKDEISCGDLVVSSGLGGSYPQGIPIGRVRSYAVKPYEASMLLELEPIVDFSRLEYVFILKVE